MVLFFADVKVFRFGPKTMDEVFTEIEVIFCSPFTPQWKVL